MPGAFEIDQVGQIQEISNEVFNIRADETPFTSMMKKDPKPSKKLADFQVEDYRKGSLNGIMDGADVTSFSHQGREMLHAVAQKFREPWMVSDFADVTQVAGLPNGETGRQKMQAAKALKFGLEGRALSDQECSIDDGGATPNETRGGLLWIDDAEQALYPVPEAFRPSADQIYEDALADLTEVEFEAMLASAFQEKHGVLDLDGYLGIELKRQMTNWTSRDPDASATDVPIRTFNQDATKKAMIKVVDFFQFDSGKVRSHLSTFIALNTDGSPSDYTHKSGLFVAVSMWAMAFMRKPGMTTLPNLGGGPRGFSDCIAMVKCFNPLAQMKVYTDS